jgi:hypothetical protein
LVEIARARLAQHGGLLTVACVVLGMAAYGPAVVGSYGRLDDYAYVVSSRTGTLGGLEIFYLDSGRPVPAFLMTSLAPRIDTIDGLLWFRVVSTLMLSLGAAAAALFAVRLVGRSGGVPVFLLAGATAAVALSTTASPSAATWAILAGALHAFPAAMAAGIWATTSQRYWWVASALLIALTAFSYQQVTPLALLAPMLWTAHRWARREPPQWSRTLVVGVMVVVMLGANYLMVQQRDGVGASRITPVTLDERIQWFVHQLLPQTIDLGVPGTPQTLWWSVALTAVLLLAPLLAGPRFLLCSFAVLLAWAGTALVVFPVELWASYRLASGAQYVLWVGCALCFAIGVASLRRPVVRASVATIGVAAALVSLFVAGQRAEDYLADPNEVDWAATRCSVDGAGDLVAGDRIALNALYSSTSAVIDMDEYGIIATSVPWAFPSAVWLAASEAQDQRMPDFQPGELVVVPVGEDTAGALVVPREPTC